ncbi:hypothetical protein [Methylobacterium thuringiense]|uniref:DUF2188 domain-containing protein n=1 Tax=Methylobacterium thuringiense TaxID=1003091 RepID=A0ABQ4TKT3_9HYPH|nr:hypothetical protein [Methylobacterium thuringiense]GJE54874.1 hypothetical protein EKPJFOCH_1359 [Methylobacterium thuringiense]
MSETRQSTPDEFHIYVSHDGAIYYRAADGTYGPDLSEAQAYLTWDEATAALEALIDGRELGRDEPGILINARRWGTS